MCHGRRGAIERDKKERRSEGHKIHFLILLSNEAEGEELASVSLNRGWGNGL